jgi:hypothetical protein
MRPETIATITEDVSIQNSTARILSRRILRDAPREGLLL